MRIAFFGKGGSGKTTLASGFIRYLVSQGNPVLAIDADHNVHLKDALGFSDEKIKALGDHYGDIVSYLKNDRDDLWKDTMIATTPPSRRSRFIHPNPKDQLLQSYALTDGLLQLLSVGTFNESDVGHNCYHGKLDSLVAILSHMLDTDDDFVVIDSTAGLDVYGTPLYFMYDLMIVVVEPTEKSVSLYRKLQDLYKTKLYVIGNKIEDDTDREFVRKNVDLEFILGFVRESPHLWAVEQGEKAAMDIFVKENTPVFEEIRTLARGIRRDWDKYLSQLIEVHGKSSEHWYDSFYDHDVKNNYDQTFNYHQVLP